MAACMVFVESFEVLVCVCVSNSVPKSESQQISIAGGQPREHSWLPNEEGYATTDMETDHLHVPAL